jgi:hypothetical protein
MRRLVVPCFFILAAATGCGERAPSVPPTAATPSVAGSPPGQPLALYAADPDATHAEAQSPATRANVEELRRWGTVPAAASADTWASYAAGAAGRLSPRPQAVAR